MVDHKLGIYDILMYLTGDKKCCCWGKLTQYGILFPAINS